MERPLAWACAALVVTSLAACSRSEPAPSASQDEDSLLDAAINIGSLRLSKEAVTIRRAGEPDARVLTDGSLLIDGREVPVTEEQRAHLREYYGAGMLLREHAKEAGIAGAKVGVAAVGAVIDGLMKGDPDSIGPKVEAEADKVKQAASKLCADIAVMRKAQDALVVGLEAFRPYARLDEDDEIDCRDGVGNEPPPAGPSDTPGVEESEVPEKPQLI